MPARARPAMLLRRARSGVQTFAIPSHDEPVAAAAFDELISPELALVDPELAERARAWLRTTGRTTAAAGWPIRPRPGSSTDTPALVTARAPVERRHRRRVSLRGLVFVVVLGLASTGLTTSWHVGERPSLVAIRGDAQARGDDGGPETTERPGATGREGVGRTQPAPAAPPRQAAPSAPPKQAAPSAPPTQAAPSAPPKQTGPAEQPVATAARTFVWVPGARATHYRVEFFRGGKRIFQAFPSRPRLVLPPRWRYAGRAERLVPGRYRWIVSPGFGPRASARYGTPIVSSVWVVRPTEAG
jgi:hypothetical protein